MFQEKYYREKLNDLSELRERGLYIIYEEKSILQNHLIEILNKKGLTPSDLSKLTGISRQSINSIIKNNMKPGIDFVLKISYVLDISVNDLFNLTKDAWIKPYKNENDSSMYLDIVKLEIIEKQLKQIFIKETGYEYYDNVENKYLSKCTRDSLLKEFIKSHKKTEILKIKENQCDTSLKTIESIALENLKKEFNKRYGKVFYRLGEKILPYKLKR